MIRANLRSNDTSEMRNSLRKLRDVELSQNKENDADVKLYPGRQASEIRKAVIRKKSKTAKKGTERKTIPELEAEETLRKAAEEIKKAAISDKPPASETTVNKAVMEIKKAVIRCGRI